MSMIEIVANYVLWHSTTLRTNNENLWVLRAQIQYGPVTASALEFYDRIELFSEYAGHEAILERDVELHSVNTRCTHTWTIRFHTQVDKMAQHVSRDNFFHYSGVVNSQSQWQIIFCVWTQNSSSAHRWLGRAPSRDAETRRRNHRCTR